MVTKLLRYAFGAACAAERPDGSSDGLPDLIRVGFIAPLYRRCEQSVGLEGGNAQVLHRLPHLSLLGSTFRVVSPVPLDRFL